MKFSIASLLLVSVMVSGAAYAQSTDSGQKTVTEGRKVKVGKTIYDFDEVDILGNLKKPDSGKVVEPPEFRFKRLLDLDESFLPEVVRSVDEF